MKNFFNSVIIILAFILCFYTCSKCDGGEKSVSEPNQEEEPISNSFNEDKDASSNIDYSWITGTWSVTHRDEFGTINATYNFKGDVSSRGRTGSVVSYESFGQSMDTDYGTYRVEGDEIRVKFKNLPDGLVTTFSITSDHRIGVGNGIYLQKR